MTTDRIEKNLIRATYRITTPMFCGGAEQQAEFRLPSFKGILRFWWRALEWGRMRNLEQLHREESELFGSSNGGQAKFLMRMKEPAAVREFTETFSPALTYLAGMGLCDRFGAFHRKPSKPDACVSVELRLKRGGNSAEDARQLQRALLAVGIFGGLGARSRRGFGSMTLESVSGSGGEWRPARSVEQLHTQIADLLSASQTVGERQLPLSAFDRRSRVVMIEGESSDTPLKLLEKVGREFVRYRTFGVAGNDGQRRNVLGEVVTQPVFQDDHDSMYDYLSVGMGSACPPRRSAFGLPHNYFFKSLSGQNRNVKAEVTPSQHDRRASPFFFHIHAPAGATPIAVCTLLPSCFLPSGDLIRISDTSSGNALTRRRFAASRQSLPADFYQPIHSFLDRFLKRSALTESFGMIQQVRPTDG